MRECCKGDDASQWGKREIRPLATPKPLNRSSQKVAHVITSWISTDMQNLVTIPQGFLFPVCAKLRIKMFTRLLFFSFFWVLPTSYSLDAWTDFHAYVKRRGSAQGCALSGLEDKILTFTPRNSRKTAIFGPDFDGTRKFSIENRYTMGVLPCKLPLIVVVAP